MFQTDDIDENIGMGMLEAVEKSVDALLKNDRNGDAYKRMSNKSAWSQGKSKLHRTETMNFIKDRAIEWRTKTRQRQRSKKDQIFDVDTNEAIVPNETNTSPVELENSHDSSQPNVLVRRTNSIVHRTNSIVHRTNSILDPNNPSKNNV